MFMNQTSVSYLNPSSIVHERKLDTALRMSQIKNVLGRLDAKELNHDDRHIFDSRHIAKDVFFTQKPDLAARIIDSILMDRTNSKQRMSQVIRMNKLSKRNIQLQLGHMLKSYGLFNKKTIMTDIDNFMNKDHGNSIITRLFAAIQWFSTTIEDTNKLATRRTHPKLSKEEILELNLTTNHAKNKELNFQLVWSNRLLYIDHGDSNTHYLLPKPYLLLIHNKLCDLASVLILCQFQCGNALPHNSFDVIVEYIMELTRLMFTYQNKYFDIAKVLEAICIAETLNEHEDWPNKSFLNILNEDVFESTGFTYIGSELQQILRTVDSPFRHELCCLSKILGHPLVDMEKGTMKIHQTANEQYFLDPRLMNEVECYIKENYIRVSIGAYHAWPPHAINSINAPKRLRIASLRNMDPNDQRLNEYPPITITDYNFVDILPNIRFSKLENVIPYLKDKTISIYRNKVIGKYIEHSLDNAQTTWKETRLLLAFLCNPSCVLNHVEYMDRYTESEDLEELMNYLVIRIVPKEKELKVEYRGFGCKTYEDRIRALAQEKNVMRYLEEFCDEQAMTLSELDIAKRLYAFRTLKKAYTKHRIIYINLDASAWNNHFRKETVDDLMINTLDKVFNYKIFSKTHLSYQKTLFYVPDEEITYHWNGQEGGIEGLNQDTWVITYISQIKTALSHMNLHYHVLCKGDDLRLAIAFPINQVDDNTIELRKKEIVANISQTAKKMGHKIKIADSYGSEKYFSFGKNASVNTIEMPQTHRKIQKCYGANNALLPTLDEYIASSFSNAHSACRVGPNTIPAYMVALYWANWYLVTDKHYSALSDTDLIGLLLVPSILGGFPIIYFHNMNVRAESDLLSPFLSLLEYTRRADRDVHDTVVKFMYVKADIPSDIVGLLKDPYSLPIDRPILPTALLRRFVQGGLKRIVKNETVIELLEAAESEESKIMIDIFKTAKYLSVKILSVMYAALPAGILDEFLRKFESARSLNEVLILQAGIKQTNQMLRRVVSAERKLQAWRVSILKGNDREGRRLTHLAHPCPATYSSKIREFAWGKKIVGITMPPLQHQISLTTEAQSCDDLHAVMNHFTYYLRHPTEFTTRDRRYQYGSALERPFLGYKTRQGTLEPSMVFIEKDALLTKLKNLIDIASWTNRSAFDDNGDEIHSNAHLLIEKIITLYTKESYENLAPFAGKRKSGTEQHHVRSPNFRESIMPNILSNLYQNIVGESNSHNTLRLSTQHYTVNFLHIYCYVTYLLQIELDFKTYFTTPDKIWAVTTNCEDCQKPIIEYPLIFDVSKLNRVRFTPITAMSVGSLAKEVIKASFKEFSTKKFNVVGNTTDIQVDIATTGVFSELERTTARHNLAIAARYTTHSITPEGRDCLASFLPTSAYKIIGESEIKGMSVEVIAWCLANVVYDHVSTKVPTVMTDEISIVFSMIPASDLPWSPLIHKFNSPNKLFPLVAYYTTQLGIAFTYIDENPLYMTRHIGQLAFQYACICQEMPPLVVTTNLEPTDISYRFKSYLKNRMWLYVKQQMSAIRNDLEDQEVHIAIYMYILWIAHNLDRLNLDASNVTESATLTFESFIAPADICDIYDLQSIENPEDFWASLSYSGHYLCKKYELEPSIIHDNILDHWDFIKDSVNGVLGGMTFQIHVTTLDMCITTVRAARPRVATFDQISKMADMTNLLFRLPNIIIKKPGWITVPRPGSDELQVQISAHIAENFINPPRVSITTQALWRPWGYSNSSASVAVEILSDLQLKPSDNHTKLTFAVLGDGLGSWTLVMCHTFKFSHCLFNTKRRTNHQQTEPYIVICDTAHQCVVDYRLINHDIWDLTQATTHREHEKIHPKNHMVVCDAEFGWEKTRDWLKCAYHTFQYFLRTGLPNSLLIIRCYIYHTDDFLRFITYANQWNITITLVKPKAVRCYLVMYAVIRLIQVPDLESVQYTIPTITNIPSSTMLFVESKIISLLKNTRDNASRNEAEIRIMKCAKYNAYWKNVLTPLACSYIYHKLSLNIVISDFEAFLHDDDGNVKSFDEIFKYPFGVENNVSVILSTLKGKGDADKIAKEFDHNTHTARVHRIRQLMACYGFIDTIKLLKRTNFRDLRCLQLRHMFVERLSSLDKRDYDIPNNLTLWNMDSKDHTGFNIRYYLHYVYGVNCVLLFISYIAASTNIMDTDVRRRHNMDLTDQTLDE